MAHMPQARSTNSIAPWGKLAHDADGHVVREQSLAGHCRDVAAVFAALVALPGWHDRLARLACRPDMDPVLRARLTYLVHLHDLGKANSGFQARRNPSSPVVGHISPLAAVIGDHADTMLNARVLAAIDAERLAPWGAGVDPLLDAILSHHGRPWPRDADGRRDAQHWRVTADGYDPVAALAALKADADRFVPDALADHAPQLPVTAPFVHAVAGLAQLADWIASSDWEHAPTDAARAAWAAERLRLIGLDPAPWRAAIGGEPPSFGSLFDAPPYPHQTLAGASPGRLLVLESETGSGKTEAALWRFATLFTAGAVDGLYFALPTRTAAAQIHARVEKFARRLWPGGAPPVVLAVPGYLDDYRAGGARADGLSPAPDPHDAPEGDVRAAPVWAAEHPKRYFAGMLAVGTIDQALLAALRVKHAHLRGAALARHLLVVDEVHASDAYMRRLLGHLLRDHLASGGHAVLLSATLGAEARHQLLVEASGGRPADEAPPDADMAAQAPYPLLSIAIPAAAPVPIAARGAGRVVAMRLCEWLDDPEAIARAALDAAETGAKVLVVRNTVEGAVAVQRALEAMAGAPHLALFRVSGVATLHHGRFAREDRRLLDTAVELEVGRTRAPGGRIVVGTQTLEQSLDIDADLLITDLCPADVLLQRLGRLHRHARDGTGAPRTRPRLFAQAQALVLTPTGGLAPFLAPTRPGGLRRHGLGHRLDGATRMPVGVYRDLTVIEATRRLIETEPCWRLPEMNRRLVEAALHSRSVDALIDSMPSEARALWRAHRSAIEGTALAASQVATDGVLRRDRPFRDPSNTRFDDRLVTRLGADDRLVALPPGTVGPFAHTVRWLAIPGWLARGVADDAVIAVSQDDQGARGRETQLWLCLGELRFIYDRHGLRRAEETKEVR